MTVKVVKTRKEEYTVILVVKVINCDGVEIEFPGKMFLVWDSGRISTMTTMTNGCVSYRLMTKK